MGKKEATFLKKKKKKGGGAHKKPPVCFHLLLKTAKVTLWLEREPGTEGKDTIFQRKGPAPSSSDSGVEVPIVGSREWAVEGPLLLGCAQRY